ncbi:hypothetical protein [Pantanalinema rosaneae]|uniref:hypothetical protein n=1 Tax=Pantanalinema rosaneae TaxID=1620701 RepID=UPI003D6FABF9
MMNQFPIKKTSQSSLDSNSIQDLFIRLDEFNQESFSGGAKEQFVRYKPYVNILVDSSETTELYGAIRATFRF